MTKPDSGGRWRAAPRLRGGRPFQPVERAHQVADALDGEAGVMAGRLDPRMTEQDLDVPDVHPGLQQVGGEGMPERVGRDGLGDARPLGGGFDGIADRVDGDRIARHLAGEQPVLRLTRLPVPLPQHWKDLRRQDGIAVLSPLALLDADDHAGTVEVADFQSDQFGDAQPGGIAKAEHDLELEAGGMVEQAGDLLGAQDDRQLVGTPDVLGQPKHGLPWQGDGVEEADPGDGLVDGGHRQATSGQVEPEQAKVVRRRLVRRTVDELGEFLDAVDISDLGRAREAADGHVVDQALAQRADGLVLGHGRLLSWVRTSLPMYSGRELFRRCGAGASGNHETERGGVFALRPRFPDFFVRGEN